MLFVEGAARWLLVLHTVVAIAAVGSATHLVLWLRPYLRGTFTRHDAVKRFGVITAALFAAAFVLGNVIYPIYKVRVKVEYLQNPSALQQDAALRLDQRAAALARYRGTEVAPPSEAAIAARTHGLPRSAEKMARWFDVKEHWVAMGLPLAVGCMILLLVWDPRRDGSGPATPIFLLALGAAATLWLGAIIGVITSSWRAIG
jgi:uncharacterized membrane protein YciS (DUF1049 family)